MPAPPKHDIDTVTHAFGVLAFHNGNETRAHRELVREGVDYDRRTLNRWRTETHKDLWYEVQDRVRVAFTEKVADAVEAELRDKLELERMTTARLIDEHDEIPTKDLIALSKSNATAFGILFDKSLMARGRPTVIVEHREPAQLYADLAELVQQIPAQPAIDVTHEEVEDAA